MVSALSTMRETKKTSNVGLVTILSRPLCLSFPTPCSVALMDRTEALEAVDFLEAVRGDVPDFLEALLLTDFVGHALLVLVSCRLLLLISGPSLKLFSVITSRSSLTMSLVSSMPLIIMFRSMLLALPFSFARPATSRSGVISPVPSSSMSLKTRLASRTLSPMAAIHVLTSGSAIMSLNSSLSMRPSPFESPPFSRRSLILFL
mmetsp:Transcript_2631/g.7430  ORF Transcript_2631/g.7430 Transcript_2631/m.7430 type:complete len:204 (+) Transcript_2631:1156-1767(+)